MIRFRKEGERLENGLNIYPLTDKARIGFVLRINDYLFWVVYSKGRMNFVIKLENISPVVNNNRWNNK